MIWRLIVAVVLLVVVVGGIVGFNMFRDQAIQGYFATMQPPPVTVSVIEAEAEHLAARASRRSAPPTRRRASTSAIEAGGIVREILFEANDRVEHGQRLVQIDDRVERADLAAAEAHARAQPRRRCKRVETLRERGVVPVSDLDVARADATNAARRRWSSCTAVMEQKALEAPFSGMIGIPQVEVGEYVEPGTVYATLQDLDTMRVDFSVPEQQIRLIEIGMPVIVSSEVGGTELDGRDHRDRAEDRPEHAPRHRARRGRQSGGRDQSRPVPAGARRAAGRGRR